MSDVIEKDTSNSGSVKRVVRNAFIAVAAFLVRWVKTFIKSAPSKPVVTKPADPAVAPSSPPLILPPDEEEKLALLYPPFADQMRQFLEKARSCKIPVGLQCGGRSYEEQAALYAQGRSTPGPIVTHSPPGFSLHNFFSAGDCAFNATPGGPVWTWSWDLNFPWKELALLGQQFGLEPGYFWPADIQDKPHYENRYGYQIAELRAFYDQGGLKAVWAAFDRSRLSGANLLHP